MSTATELQRIIDSKAAIKTAIEGKGVTVGTGTIDTYAAKIDEIIADVEVVIKDYLVRFFDYDGTILKEQWVYSGETATAPNTPNHEYLTFAEWNNTFTNVTEDIDTGAIYNTTDGKTYLFVTLNAVTGLAPVLYFNKTTTSLMTIDWGDGQTSTSTTSGNQNLSHTYATYGDYIITVDNSNGSNFNFGNATNTTQIFGANAYAGCLTKVHLGSNYTALVAYVFNLCMSLEYITLPSYALLQSSGYIFVFSGCFNLKFFICHKYSMAFYTSYFSNCHNLENIVFVSTAVYAVYNTTFTLIYKIEEFKIKNYQNNIGGSINAFTGCINVKKHIIPASITSIGNTAYANLYNCCCYLVYPTTPPTLGTSVFSGINSLAKIYVPDAVVDTYKAATGWIAYANYIYPLSTYIPN